MKVFEGDEWKQEPAREVRLIRRSRAEQQEHANYQYATGAITLEQWQIMWLLISNEDASGKPRKP